MEQDLNHPNFDKTLDLGRDRILFLPLLRKMMLIRETESQIAFLRRFGKIGGPVHLAAGQEAIAVGVSAHLSTEDSVFSAHRSHAHLLALTNDPYPLLAEVLGKSTGHSRGFGGSMHLWAGHHGFQGSAPIVAGTVPLALGAAFASISKGSSNIAIAYLGDGAMEEGIVHESMNLASVLSLPVLFVCENNFFSSHMHISQRQPSNFNARFAQANQIDSHIIDGNDIGIVVRTAEQVIKRIRKTSQPAFIEAFTFRHYGHVDWREDTDVGISRSASDLELWKTRDPILRLKNELLRTDDLSEHEYSQLQNSVIDEVRECLKRAQDDLAPDESNLLSNVYFEDLGS
jgi:TPP-dependent pyruvate/acetoin dehydrogenase alpha subunit